MRTKDFSVSHSVDTSIQALLSLSYITIVLLILGFFFFSYIICGVVAFQLLLLLSFCY